MLHRQRLSEVLLNAGGRSAAQTVDGRGQWRPLRLSLVFLLLLSLALLGLGVARSLSPLRMTETLQTFSDAWARLLAAASLTWAPRPSADANAPTANVAPTLRAPAPLAVSNAGEGDVIAYGDRLKITFYESVGVKVDSSNASSDRVVAAVFPRMDLSAEYEVNESGSVNIPKLGQIFATGQSIVALQSELAAAFQRAIGRSSDVHVGIIGRQPIYVLGTVRNAGSFKFTPGMTVLQALADAGGRDLGDTSRAIEATRETERLRQAEDKMDRLVVKQAMLIARRENSDSIVLSADTKSRLSRTSSPERLKALIAGAAAILSADRKSYQQQLVLAQRQVAIARTEVEAQNMRVGQLKDLLAKKQERLHGLEGIAASGSVPRYKLTDVNADISELVARQEDLRVTLAQAERRLIEAEIAQAKVERDYPAETERDLATTQEAIDDCTRAIASMQAVTRILDSSLPQAASGSAGTQSLIITRRAGTGLTTIPAADTTLLLPGDVLQVNSTTARTSETSRTTAR